jgi:hypothetical protein
MAWLRSSGSYLNDRRAKTLDEAVTWPGGRRPDWDRRFQPLTEVGRLQVQAFLKTLVAPASANSHEVSLALDEGVRGAAEASATSGTGGPPRKGVRPA